MSVERTNAVASSGISKERDTESRFEFGKNWSEFIKLISPERIRMAEESLKEMLETNDLRGVRFLDIGSGSGLFSLAAHNLGAEVHSFDYDDESVACTSALRKHHCGDDNRWNVEHGDALDREYLVSLGHFDIVYSWGVLHHTGDMWEALSNTSDLVKPGGKLFVAIYNDQGWLSNYWTGIKRLYNKRPVGRALVKVVFVPYFAARFTAKALLQGSRGGLRRGMDKWRDVYDWLGGWPFEVAKPEAIFEFFHSRGFDLEKMTTVGGRLGCNEFVFRRRAG